MKGLTMQGRMCRVMASRLGHRAIISRSLATSRTQQSSRNCASLIEPAAGLSDQAEHGFGFSAGGLLFPYFIGVFEALQKTGLLTAETPVAGASAGALIAACTKSGLSGRELLHACLELASDCRNYGTRLRLRSVLEGSLRNMLPENVHEMCSGNVYVAVTQVYPTPAAELVCSFDSRDELIQTLLTSAHIPLYMDGSIITRYRNGWYLDGGFTNFIPVPPVASAVRVCCFPTRSATGIWGAAFKGVDIAPDTFEEWPHDLRTMVQWALEPAAEDTLMWLVERGRSDAMAWAAASGPPPLLLQSTVTQPPSPQPSQIVLPNGEPAVLHGSPNQQFAEASQRLQRAPAALAARLVDRLER